jgi:hypothetical protein
VSPGPGPEPAAWGVNLDEADLQALGVDLLRRGSPLPVRLSGSCMRPWAFPGDRLIVAPLAGPVRLGMVVLTRARGVVRAHRVVAVSRAGRVRTRGDLEPVADAWVDRDDVLGQVVEVRSHLGYRLRLDRPGVAWVGRWSAPLWRVLRELVRRRGR